MTSHLKRVELARKPFSTLLSAKSERKEIPLKVFPKRVFPRSGQYLKSGWMASQEKEKPRKGIFHFKGLGNPPFQVGKAYKGLCDPFWIWQLSFKLKWHYWPNRAFSLSASSCGDLQFHFIQNSVISFWIICFWCSCPRLVIALADFPDKIPQIPH